MSHGGDQVRPAAVCASATLRVPQRDREAADRTRVMVPPVAGLTGLPVAAVRLASQPAVLAPVPDVAHADHELGPVRQVQQPLRMAGPGAQAVIGSRLRPPAAILVVPERKHLLHVPAERGVRADAGEPRGRLVEHRHPAGVVRYHQAVGQVIGTDQAAGHVPGRLERTARGREVPARIARHDPVHSNAASA